jgi:hypothetical protein
MTVKKEEEKVRLSQGGGIKSAFSNENLKFKLGS